MKKYLFIIQFIVIAGVIAAETVPVTTSSTSLSPLETLVIQLLNSAKAVQTKFQAKQDYANELKTIIDAKKTVETIRLKTAIELTQQQVELEKQKADKTVLADFEAQRRTVSTQFNELIRLINQVNKHQNKELLSEKLTDLIVFLEPAVASVEKDRAEKTPTKPLLRGATPEPQPQNSKNNIKR